MRYINLLLTLNTDIDIDIDMHNIRGLMAVKNLVYVYFTITRSISLHFCNYKKNNSRVSVVFRCMNFLLWMKILRALEGTRVGC